MRALALLLLAVLPAAVQDYPRESPFTGCRWTAAGMEVEFEHQWWLLRSIDGADSAQIEAFARQRYGSRWKKRVAEDLVEVLTEMGSPPGSTVELVLEGPDGALRTVPRAPMTAANRRAVWDARRRAEFNRREGPTELLPPRRVARKHAATTPPSLRHLQRRIPAESAWARAELSAMEAIQDLNELEWQLEDRFAYLELRGVDYRAALDAVRAGIGGGISRGAFALQIAKVLALFGDGHTRLDVSSRDLLPQGFLPCLVGDSGGRLVAVRADRESLLHPEHPWLVAIDGVETARWLTAAATLAADGSPQFRRHRSVRNLRYLNWLRHELDLPRSGEVRLTLADDRGRRMEERLPVAARRPLYGHWPRNRSQVLDGRWGYFRLAAMDGEPAFVDALRVLMAELRQTEGMILDLRGNGGGTRHALRTLLPYFMREDEGPTVVNVAAYRLPRGTRGGDPEGYLDNRFLFPAGSRLWNQRQRAAVEALARGFEPEWILPEGYSALHYMVVDPVRDPPPFRYDRPLVILQDAGCFSATDIFLGAFEGRDLVSLVGSPSGGGSGRARKVTLHHSGIPVLLSSMASFRPDGRLYEGRGIEPDLFVGPQPLDFTKQGDSVLSAAIEHLQALAVRIEKGPDDR